ncbi:hypothetical protein [Microbacterium aurantiacum]|uniref:hypothetical protein n=1 Tax=Microbacterium aurantiacum TaxID=162393 RepID=UPI000C7FEFB8|nr:hypothetical protein [Microbacterium aurantiacum]
MRRARPWLIGAALVVAAGLVSGVTPSQDSLVGPFLISGGPADTVTSRMLIASVSGASFADRVVAADGEWEAEGNWLVVELAVSAAHTEVDAEIPLATLHLDGRVFHASERAPESLLQTRLHVGTDTVGTLAFELPEGLRGGLGELRLTHEYLTPELDDVVAITLPLDEAPTASSIELDAPRVGAP